MSPSSQAPALPSTGRVRAGLLSQTVLSLFPFPMLLCLVGSEGACEGVDGRPCPPCWPPPLPARNPLSSSDPELGEGLASFPQWHSGPQGPGAGWVWAGDTDNRTPPGPQGRGM